MIYLADDDFDGVIELYSSRVDGGDGGPLKLHDSLAPPHSSRRDVIAFLIAPPAPGRSTKVLYALGDDDTYDFELWTVEPDDPSSRAPLLPEGMFGENPVGNFALTPDGSQIVFNAFLDGARDRELFSVRIDDPASVVKLSEGPVDSGGLSSGPVAELLVSPNSQWVVYVAKRDDTHTGVFSAEIGVPTSENHLNAEHDFNDSGLARMVSITPDSKRVLFLGKEFSSRDDLASVPIACGDMTRLSTSGDGSVLDYSLPADDSCDQVLFRTGGPATENPRLWLSGTGGGSPTRLREHFNSSPYGFSPHGCGYAFIDDGILFSGASGSAQNISRDPTSDALSFVFHPDGSHITFLADRDVDSEHDLYTIPAGGGEAQRLYLPHYKIDAYKVVNNSAGEPHVLFVGRRDGEDVTRLFSVPALPAATLAPALDLSGTISPGGGAIANLDHIRVSLNATEDRVVFAGDLHSEGVIELFSIPFSGGEPIRLSDGDAPVGEVGELWTTVDTTDPTDEQPRGRKWVVYRADADHHERHDLYAVPASRESTPVLINEIVARTSMDDTSGPVRFSNDGSHAFFLGPAEDSPSLKLFMHRFTTGLTQQLSPEIVAPNSEVLNFLVHPNGTSLIYLADHGAAGIEELYRVDFTVAAPQSSVTKLTPDLDFLGVHEDFRISGDGGAVILRGDLRTKRQTELFSLDLASLELTRLSLLQRDEAEVEAFHLAPDSQAGVERIVFLADGQVQSRDELYVTALDRPIGLLPISGELIETGDVFGDFAVTFDGRQVVFRADAQTENLAELFSVELGAAVAARIELHSNLQLDSPGVPEFVLNASDSQDTDAIEVAFRAGPVSGGGDLELFLATVGQRHSATQVSPMSEHNDAEVLDDYAFTVDGDTLLFRGDALRNSHFSLYRWTSGQAASSPMHPPFAGNATVLSFAPSPDSYRIAYVVGDREVKPGTLGEITTTPRRLVSASLDTPIGEIPQPTPMSLADGEFADVSDTVALAYLPCGSQLLFLDDRRKDDTWELFTAYEPIWISPIEDRFIPADQTSNPIAFTIRDYETRPSLIQVTANSSDPALIPDEGIVVTRELGEWQITLTPTPGATGGPITITLWAEGNGEAVRETFAVCIGSAGDGYQSWLEQFFEPGEIGAPAVGDYLADPDQDGILNIAEWATGLDPSLPETDRGIPEIHLEGEEAIISFRRAKLFPKALRIDFETSGQLGTWRPLPLPEEFTVVEDLGTAELVETRVRLPDGITERWFMRLRYSLMSD